MLLTKIDRVGKLRGGIKFLELSGFERIEGGAFLCTYKEKKWTSMCFIVVIVVVVL